jgi:hypothetical protein
MGEPIPGDICDPIRLHTEQIALKTGISGKKGDYLVKDSTNDWFTVIVTTTVAEVADAVTADGIYQAQEDFDTTGIADGAKKIACFGVQSRIYGAVAAALVPGQTVSLHVLVDDSPGPAVVGFGPLTLGTNLGKYIKMSGATVAQKSTPANGTAVIDLGGP